MFNLFKKKPYKCLICNKRVGNSAAEVKYKYMGDGGEPEIGTARLCNKHAKQFEKQNTQDVFNEPF